MSDLFEDVGEGDDFDCCHHGVGFDEECELCAEEEDFEDDEEIEEDDPTEVEGVDYLNNWAQF